MPWPHRGGSALWTGVTVRPPDFRREPYNDPNLPLGVIGLAVIGVCVLVGAFAGTWAGIALFLALILARFAWSYRHTRRVLRSEEAADPSQTHMRLKEEWRQAIRYYGEESPEARSAKQRYEEELVRFVRWTSS